MAGLFLITATVLIRFSHSRGHLIIADRTLSCVNHYLINRWLTQRKGRPTIALKFAIHYLGLDLLLLIKLNNSIYLRTYFWRELDLDRGPLVGRRLITFSRAKLNSGHVTGIRYSNHRPRRTKGMLTKPLRHLLINSANFSATCVC